MVLMISANEVDLSEDSITSNKPSKAAEADTLEGALPKCASSFRAFLALFSLRYAISERMPRWKRTSSLADVTQVL